MKFLISSLLLSLILLELCQAQDQNCKDDSCDHARKKRQVIEEILNEVEEVDREKREAFFGKKHGSRFGHFSSASARSHGHSKHASRHSFHHGSSFDSHGSSHGHHASSKFVHHHKREADAQSQNCFGSACNQNNFGKKKRDIVEAINSLTAEVIGSEDAVEEVEVQEKARREADPQSQNCFGSACNQNNFGKKKREASEDDVDEVAEAREKARRDADPQSQNCFGSACNQNNFGKKKREADAQSQNCFGSACNQNNFGKKKRDIVEAINSLTSEVIGSEDAVEEVAVQEKARRDADPQSQSCFGSACNQNNFGKKKREASEDDVDEFVEAQKERRDADPQSQNCFGSACNQNNFGKKKREVVEDDVDEVAEAQKERRDADPQSQNCFGSACNQNNFGKKKRDADAQSQNCFGSACNQNNFGKKKRDIVEAINSLTADVLESEDVDEVVEGQEKERRDAEPQSQNCFGSACNQNNFGKKKRDADADADAQSQNCFGSACNQNNFGKKKRDAVEDDVGEVAEAQDRERRNADPQSQNCFGSACNQNNFGKKKREILEAVNSLTEEMLKGEEAAAVGVAEDDVDEQRERRDADAQSQNCFGSFCNQNNGRKKRDIIAALLGELL